MNAMADAVSAKQKGARLEDEYTRIRHGRMRDMPVINPALRVEAVGFRAWNGYVLGCLVTPWFMNLILLPDQEEAWKEIPAGSKRSYVFDAGSFEFIAGEEPGVGKFMSCSMFSPMFEFESHGAAVATAQAVMAGLFDARNIETFKPHSLGEQPAKEPGGKSLFWQILERMEAMGEATENREHEPISRRDLLRGKFLNR